MIGWVHATGSLSSYLLALPPLLVLVHRASGGREIGLWAFCAASVLHLGAVILESTGVLPRAPVYVLQTAPALGGSVPLTVLAVFMTYVAALAFGSALSTAGSHSRGSEGIGESATPRGEAGRQVGRVLADRYRLTGLIGRSVNGEVYAGERLRDGSSIAVKILHRHLIDSPQALARVWTEIGVVSRLTPARAPAVFDFGTTEDGTSYIVMEHLEGEDLAHLLRRVRRLPLDRTVEIIDQIAAALEAAAERGIHHGNIKPRNVFLVGKSEVKLLDWGTARMHRGGAPGFLAPEQAEEGVGEIGPPTDVFALAAIAYRVLSGENAFPSTHPATAAYEALHHQPRPIRALVCDLPEQLESVLAIALAKQPEQRYAGALQFARDLRAAAAGALSTDVINRAKALRPASGADTATISVV